MCVLAFAWRSHPRWPLVLIGNRDELHARAAEPLHRWPHLRGVIAGRDLASGGAWLGVSEAGRLAVVTNRRGARPPRADAPSRGLLVRDILAEEGDYAVLRAEKLEPFNAMDLVVIDGDGANLWSNVDTPAERRLGPGLHALSNGGAAAPWPKTERLKRLLAEWLAGPADTIEPLFDALADEARPPDADLPATGLDPERERLHSAIFIRDPVYGTRCSTVVRVDADGQGTIAERRFDTAGGVTGETVLRFAWAGFRGRTAAEPHRSPDPPGRRPPSH